MEDCSCLAQDASRIFGVYWELGAQKNSSLPHYWPGRFSALSSIKYPLTVKFNGVPARVYLSVSSMALLSQVYQMDATLCTVITWMSFFSVSKCDHLLIKLLTTVLTYSTVIHWHIHSHSLAFTDSFYVYESLSLWYPVLSRHLHELVDCKHGTILWTLGDGKVPLYHSAVELSILFDQKALNGSH